jgi:predicted regulator of Ras-like GTPase activity (Roadblock/LC7/MglB family)
MEELNAILQELADIQGVKTVLVVGNDGQILDAIDKRDNDFSNHAQSLAVIADRLEYLGAELGLGSSAGFYCDFTKGKIVVFTCEPASIVIMTESKTNLGLMRIKLRDMSESIVNCINELDE